MKKEESGLYTSLDMLKITKEKLYVSTVKNPSSQRKEIASFFKNINFSKEISYALRDGSSEDDYYNEHDLLRMEYILYQESFKDIISFNDLPLETKRGILFGKDILLAERERLEKNGFMTSKENEYKMQENESNVLYSIPITQRVQVLRIENIPYEIGKTKLIDYEFNGEVRSGFFVYARTKNAIYIECVLHDYFNKTDYIGSAVIKVDSDLDKYNPWRPNHVSKYS